MTDRPSRNGKTARENFGRWGYMTRAYPMPTVGDLLGGNLKVVAVPPRGPHGVRVEVVCVSCGKRSETYDFNARKGHPTCAGYEPTQPKQRVVSLERALLGVRGEQHDARPLYVRALVARGSYRP